MHACRPGLFPFIVMAGACLLVGGVISGSPAPAAPGPGADPAEALFAPEARAGEDSPASPFGTAPGCVTTSLDDRGWTDRLTVYNGCSRAVRIKVVLAHGTDFPCYTLGPGQSRNYSWGYPRRFDRLETC